MTVNFRGPYWVEILSHSIYAPHSQNICIKNWTPGGGYGDIENWDATTQPADTMIDALITLEKAFYPASYTFDGWLVWKQLLPTDVPLIVADKNIAVVGTNATPGNTKAVQATWTFRTTIGGIFKIVQLDMGNNNSFEKVKFAGLGADGLAFVQELEVVTNGWSGRDNARPNFFNQVAYTLNEKLRRSYREN